VLLLYGTGMPCDDVLLHTVLALLWLAGSSACPVAWGIVTKIDVGGLHAEGAQ
jgi:hypothetical protein